MNTTTTSGSAKPKSMIKRKRKKKSKIYFGTPVQNAIIRYNDCSSTTIKNRIYKEHIQFAFNKLAENLIHTFKFYYFDYADAKIPTRQRKSFFLLFSCW